jgi:hypothetical protein
MPSIYIGINFNVVNACFLFLEKAAKKPPEAGPAGKAGPHVPSL